LPIYKINRADIQTHIQNIQQLVQRLTSLQTNASQQLTSLAHRINIVQHIQYYGFLKVTNIWPCSCEDTNIICFAQVHNYGPCQIPTFLRFLLAERNWYSVSQLSFLWLTYDFRYVENRNFCRVTSRCFRLSKLENSSIPIVSSNVFTIWNHWTYLFSWKKFPRNIVSTIFLASKLGNSRSSKKNKNSNNILVH